jgi:hypothetical protein
MKLYMLEELGLVWICLGESLTSAKFALYFFQLEILDSCPFFANVLDRCRLLLSYTVL